MKVKHLIVFTCIGLILSIIALGSYKPYQMPAGYRNARQVWEQLGLPPAGSVPADGSPSRPYDVIVWGSDPEGIAAALSAARNGLSTLLIDHRRRVGGLFTLGELNFLDFNYDDRQQVVTKGIFEEFYRKAGGMVFDLAKGEETFEAMLAAEPLITIQLNRRLLEPIVAATDNRLAGIKVITADGQQETVYGKIIIDASQDAVLAELAGVPFTKGMEDIGLPGKYQAATLVFRLKGISWPRVMWETVVKDRRPTSSANLRAAWGYDNYVSAYQPDNPAVAFRGLNMARQKNGEVVINGLLIYGVDGLDEQAKTRAIETAKAEAHKFVAFARENLPGFQKAEIAGFAEELYIRETNHMLGLYRLTLDDVLENRDHPDRIGYGAYPVDIQAVDPHTPGIAIGKGDKYAIPLRCLIPPHYHNVLVVGRSASFDSLAHGSARIVGVGMVSGQAAGVAAAYSLATQKSLQEIPFDKEAMEFIRQVLASQGAYVEPSNAAPPDITGHRNYDALKKLRSLGLVAGGYKNRYYLDEPLPVQSFLNIVFHAGVRTLNIGGHHSLAKQCQYVVYPEHGQVTVDNLPDLLDYFGRFNPHLSPVLKDPAFRSHLEAVTAGQPAGSEIPRGELYELVARYLAILERGTD